MAQVTLYRMPAGQSFLPFCICGLHDDGFSGPLGRLQKLSYQVEPRLLAQSEADAVHGASWAGLGQNMPVPYCKEVLPDGAPAVTASPAAGASSTPPRRGTGAVASRIAVGQLYRNPSAAAGADKVGLYPKLSLFSTAQPIYTSFSIIFSSCVSKVTIGYHPRPRRWRGARSPRPPHSLRS
jgi:hypothetical protein